MDVESAFTSPRLCAYAAMLALIFTIAWTPPNAVAASDPGQVIGWGLYGPYPQPVPTALSNPGALRGKTVTALDIGQSICALADGHIYCWGGGANASFPGSGSPAPVLVDSGSLAGKLVDRLSVGSTMACAVAEGRAHCWGSGPLGDGHWSSHVPVPVALTGKTVQAVSVGDQTACLVAEGNLYCWGYAGVGAGIPIPQEIEPMGVLAGKVVTDVSVGPNGSACVIADGSAYCNLQSANFAPVTSANTVTAIAVGESHSCLLAGGQAYCWGSNSRGQLGNGTTTPSTQPAPINVTGALSGRTVQGVTVGKEHTCALAEGGVFCWGDNTFDQLGTADGSYSAVPVWTGSGHLVAAGPMENCSAREQTVSCWGWGVTKLQRNGQAFALNVRATRLDGNCAVIDGRVQCWMEASGPTMAVTPLAVAGLPSGRVADLSSSAWHACAIVAGKAYCWGANNYGQLGNGTRKKSSSAARVISRGAWGADRVTAISAGQSHTCAVAGGKAYCWGRGSLGTALAQRSTTPLRVPVPGKRVSAISAGAGEWVYEDPADETDEFTGRTDTCAVSDARLYCWGWNTFGQLGTGGTRSASKPTLVAYGGLRDKKINAISLTAADRYWPRTCAIAKGRAYCWGRDVGKIPTGVAGLPDARVKQVAVGLMRNCALVQRAVWCWGGHSTGSTPFQVNTSYLKKGRVVELSSSADSGIWRS